MESSLFIYTNDTHLFFVVQWSNGKKESQKKRRGVTEQCENNLKY